MGKGSRPNLSKKIPQRWCLRLAGEISVWQKASAKLKFRQTRTLRKIAPLEKLSCEEMIVKKSFTLLKRKFVKKALVYLERDSSLRLGPVQLTRMKVLMQL